MVYIIDDAISAAPPHEECPPGWEPAYPPLNPAIGCIPTWVTGEPSPELADYNDFWFV